MNDLFRDLVQERNEALAAKGRNDVRWRWKNAQDHGLGMELVDVRKPSSKMVERPE
ncbi:hypothetical protein [Caenibius sp. WL]|uniref:hypothetical protein n=1 Tax=Caenibius sp. WL TaxID=2872646 RepID=UPI001C99063E|nr:hypothetical protein [Caenibius sp. WL]QZP06812.1 hypothetical protein K5X80_08730 [Caenibius sp. WL]